MHLDHSQLLHIGPQQYIQRFSEANRLIRVLVKTTDHDGRRSLKTEGDSYRRPAISSSPCVRKMCDIIGDHDQLEEGTEKDTPSLVFGWMDSPEDHLHNNALYKAIFEAGLGCLAALRHEKLVHAGGLSIP